MMFGRVEAVVIPEPPDRLRLTVHLETGRRMQTVRDEIVLALGPIDRSEDLPWQADQYAQETIANELALAGWEVIGGGELPAFAPGELARSATYAVRRMAEAE